MERCRAHFVSSVLMPRFVWYCKLSQVLCLLFLFACQESAGGPGCSSTVKPAPSLRPGAPSSVLAPSSEARSP